jgi:hypothetical protein
MFQVNPRSKLVRILRWEPFRGLPGPVGPVGNRIQFSDDLASGIQKMSFCFLCCHPLLRPDRKVDVYLICLFELKIWVQVVPEVELVYGSTSWVQ